MSLASHRHPTSQAQSGIVVIPYDCDVCGSTNHVQVPRLAPAEAVWLARGHTATTVAAQCEQCNRRCVVEFSLGARVVSPPPMPLASWHSRVAFA